MSTPVLSQPIVQHPSRVVLHNEIHARPPEAMSAPLAISHVVMVCDPQERAASRAHVAELLRNHHLPLPDDHANHFRMDVGPYRIRWEAHTEFVSWTFLHDLDDAHVDDMPQRATEVVPQDWLSRLPGQCLSSLHLWALPHQETTACW